MPVESIFILARPTQIWCQWFDMSNADMRYTRSIYLAVLRKTCLPHRQGKREEKAQPKMRKRK
jgi:hypothetical protein